MLEVAEVVEEMMAELARVVQEVQDVVVLEDPIILLPVLEQTD